ncbi:hypothetical protein GOL96_15455 [Sinorhizobium medicae]|nr:hypothetical protein [Sinorhizobium medicae]MDX1235235.1 hypothetical protein [Sinorhizobium medicae]
MTFIQSLLHQSPEIALFLALAGGYWIGKFQFGKFQLGKFQLGGVAGSLLVAVLISQIGVTIGNGIKAVLFALFIYAVGFESGPQFFRSLGRQSIREIIMAAVLAITGLVTVEWFTGRSIRDDAIKAEAEMLAGASVYGVGEQPALPMLVGRLFSVERAAGRIISELERKGPAATISIERVKRGCKLIGNDPGLVLEKGDILLVVGLLIGLVIRLGSVPLTLGGGGGALLSRLVFGWFRTRNMAIAG